MHYPETPKVTIGRLRQNLSAAKKGGGGDRASYDITGGWKPVSPMILKLEIKNNGKWFLVLYHNQIWKSLVNGFEYQ